MTTGELEIIHNRLDNEAMEIREATEETLKLPVNARSHFSFNALRQHVTIADNEESFVKAYEFKAAGFCLEPFWETPGDLEGEAYAHYRSLHPEFDVSLRRGAFERLVRANNLLPGDWQIVIKAAFRPLAVQQNILATFVEASKGQHPAWTEVQHLAHARTFVSDPQLGCPPHLTGGAVDVAVKHRQTGEYIDMGCPPNTDDERAFLHSPLITAAQQQCRRILLSAMLEAGFAPNVHEWWHYQYGETYWAAFYSHDTTLYGPIRTDR